MSDSQSCSNNPAELMLNTVAARDMTLSCARCTITSQLYGVHCNSYSLSHGGNAAGHFNNVAPIKASQTALPCLRCIDTLLHICVNCTLDMHRETAAHIMTVLPYMTTAVSRRTSIKLKEKRVLLLLLSTHA